MELRNIASHLNERPIKPFLKWAGAKTQVVKNLRLHFPHGNYRFIEPFVGSGVVFMNVPYRTSLLSDTNQDIIDLYSVLKAKPLPFIQRCKSFFTPENNSEEVYYDFREEFNSCKDRERRAALFVYLNRHCFNGLCRYNQKGGFNTPFGRYGRVFFPEAAMEAFAKKLQRASLRNVDFRAVLSKAKAGDVVYCDPPYVPLTNTANFTSYAAGGFSLKDQEDLKEFAVEASERGAVVILSNHDTPFTRKLYQRAEVIPLLVTRTISCDGQNRKKAKELILVFGDARSVDFRLTS
jgi:DNA adenine methylase